MKEIIVVNTVPSVIVLMLDFVVPYFWHIVCTFLVENDAEIIPVHYTWKVAFPNLIHKQSIQVKL
jgi:hypothetical protein